MALGSKGSLIFDEIRWKIRFMRNDDLSRRSIVFDVTDLVGYLLNSPQVTGIQRYQVCAIGACAKLRPEEVFIEYCGDDGRRHLFQAHDVLVDVKPEPVYILARLGLIHAGIPNRMTVKRLLANYGKRKVARAVRKIDIYVSSRWRRERYMRILSLPHDLPSRAIPADSRVLINPVRILSGVWIDQPYMHQTTQAHFRSGHPTVQIIHDLIPALRPDWFGDQHSHRFLNWLKTTVPMTSHYVCVSESTRDDLQKILPGIGPRVSVVHLQHSFPGAIRVQKCVEGDEVLARRSVLCVGTLEIRKNGSNLLRAWKILLDRLGEESLPDLVFAGKRGWRLREFDELLASDPALVRKIHFTGPVSDEQLAELYHSSLFTVYPSFYEGWGLPVGESLWFGRCCITSAVSSMPEVGGDLCTYVDPSDVSALADAMELLITNHSLRHAMEQRIRQAPLRVWTDVGADLLKVLDHLPTVLSAVSMCQAPVDQDVSSTV